jgi:hypothetical protein
MRRRRDARDARGEGESDRDKRRRRQGDCRRPQAWYQGPACHYPPRPRLWISSCASVSPSLPKRVILSALHSVTPRALSPAQLLLRFSCASATMPPRASHNPYIVMYYLRAKAAKAANVSETVPPGGEVEPSAADGEEGQGHLAPRRLPPTTPAMLASGAARRDGPQHDKHRGAGWATTSFGASGLGRGCRLVGLGVARWLHAIHPPRSMHMCGRPSSSWRGNGCHCWCLRGRRVTAKEELQG